HSPGGGSMPKRNQAGQPGDGAPGPERPGWLFLAAAGLIYAGALLGMWIVLAGQPDIQDLVVGSVAAVLAVGTGYLVSQRGKMVLQVALIPCAWVCWRFGPEHRVVALGLAGTVQALAILCLAVGYREPGLASMAVVLAALSSGGSVAFARFLERWL